MNFAPGQHSEKSHHHTMDCCTTDPSQSAVEHTQLCATQADVGRHLMHCLCFLPHSYSNAADSSAGTGCYTLYTLFLQWRGVGQAFYALPSTKSSDRLPRSQTSRPSQTREISFPSIPLQRVDHSALERKHGHMTIIGKPSFSLSCT